MRSKSTTSSHAQLIGMETWSNYI